MLGVLVIIVGLVSLQALSFWREKKSVLVDFKTLVEELKKTEEEQEAIQAELEYLANPINLEKEIRARFNLKKPGEKTIIVVPQASTSGN